VNKFNRLCARSQEPVLNGTCLQRKIITFPCDSVISRFRSIIIIIIIIIIMLFLFPFYSLSCIEARIVHCILDSSGKKVTEITLQRIVTKIVVMLQSI
jgi:hypothetical protein